MQRILGIIHQPLSPLPHLFTTYLFTKIMGRRQSYFISILHLHTHIKGRENSRLFVQHDIALKIPFCFYKNHFYNDIHNANKVKA
jgi:hypothetical protein